MPKKALQRKPRAPRRAVSRARTSFVRIHTKTHDELSKLCYDKGFKMCAFADAAIRGALKTHLKKAA